ncbi:MAG TPA: SGNH/GDSL hydrolase family protein, partial [Verrucomicrobiae bacterium]|nr:SGNH/GDSL hydrolase family protein [Verrucomicrobiae bacterium]
MRQTNQRQSRRRLTYWSALALILACIIVGTSLTHAVNGNTTGTTPDWGGPNAITLRKVSPLGNMQDEPNLLSNLDCSPMTYRLVASSTMQTGCFTPTAFGLLDSDNDTVIFNGTDEGLPLTAYSPHQVLAPWPKALDLITLDATNTGGSYISLYKNPFNTLRDQRNLLGQLTAKQLAAPPELLLQDPAGQHLIVNPQTIAFSSSGSWLVAETLEGSFVRINLATLAMTPFAPAITIQGNPALLKSQVAISDDGRYVAIENDTVTSFKVYDLSTCSGGNSSSLTPQHCQSYDYRAFVQQQIPGLQSVRHVRFVNDGLVSFEAMAASTSNNGIYELAPTDTITSLTNYIGLGDSYTSGEGAFDYLPGTDTSDNMCHLSSNSYPLLLTRDVFGVAGGHSVACSGATINDVGSTNSSYRGQVKDVLNLEQLEQTDPSLLASVQTNFLPGYVAQQLFVAQYQPQVVTVSIGGNDIGFGDILQRCVESQLSRHASDETCYNTYEDREEVVSLVNRTVPRWTALYKQLLAEAPGERLYAIGYPQIFDDAGSCGLNVHLDKSELEFAEELTDYLNSAIQQAAAAASVAYVDIDHALDGHRLCEAASYDVAANGLTAGTDAGAFGLKLLGKESYHPNALGQALIEQAILQQTHNLQVGAGSNPPFTSSDNLLQAPKSGRSINTLIPSNGLMNSVVGTGGSSQLAVDGLTSGLVPNAPYTVHMDGSTGIVIGTLTAGSSGDISGSITIPSTTSPGGHTIDITGPNQAGEPVDITQPIYVPASNSDA